MPNVYNEIEKCEKGIIAIVIRITVIWRAPAPQANAAHWRRCGADRAAFPNGLRAKAMTSGSKELHIAQQVLQNKSQGYPQLNFVWKMGRPRTA